MTKLTKLFMLCLFGMISIGASAYDFSAVNAEGVTLYYNIVSETDLTCELTNSGNDEIKYSGDIIVPGTVNYKSKTLTVVGTAAYENAPFDGCIDLLSVELPNTFTYLKAFAFQCCSKLKTINIPSSINFIGQYTFYGTNSDLSVYITDLEKWVERDYDISDGNPLMNGAKLYLNGQLVTEANLSSVTKIGERSFSGYKWLSSITIPNTAVSIGGMAFSGCGLTTIDIPNTIESIAPSAFGGCNLTSVVIPNSVKSIGNGAFNDNPNLRAISVNWDEPIAVSGEGITSTRDIALIVPVGTKEKYMAADVWKDFFEIVEVDKVAEEIALNKESVVLDLGQEIMLKSSVLPSDASVQSVGWSSSDPSVATVDRTGKVRGNKKGTATITAKTLDGSNISKSCEVIVRRGDVHVEGNSIYAKISTLTSGTQMTLPIYMTNDWNSICSFQFDIEIPEGFSIATTGRKPTYVIEANSERFAGLDHTISSSLQSDGTIRVLCSSLTNSNIRRTNDAGEDIGALPILYITLDVDEDITTGDYVVKLSNINMVEYDGTEAHSVGYNGSYESSILVNRYYFTAKSSDKSRGNVAINGADYDEEGSTAFATTDLTVTAIPESGFSFVEWKEAELDSYYYNYRELDNTMSIENPFTISVNKETHVLAKFTKTADVVEDGVINVADLSDCVALILKPSTENRRRFVAADVLKDGVIDVADYSNIAAIILNGGVSAAKSEDFTKYVINMQYDMHIPADLNMNADEIAVALRQTALAKNHSIVTRELENGDIRVLVLSMQNDEIADAKAMLEEIAMPATEATGEYNITLSNIILAYNDLSKEEVSMMNQKLMLTAPTGIGLAPIFTEGEGASYNLNGQKLQKAKNGINIIEGKKYIIK